MYYYTTSSTSPCLDFRVTFLPLQWLVLACPWKSWGLWKDRVRVLRSSVLQKKSIEWMTWVRRHSVLWWGTFSKRETYWPLHWPMRWSLSFTRNGKHALLSPHWMWSVHCLNRVCVRLTLFRFEVKHFAGWEDGHGRVFWRDWQPPETGQCLHFPCDSVAGQWDPPRVCRYLLSVQVSRPFALPTQLSTRMPSFVLYRLLYICETLTLLRNDDCQSLK